MKAVLCKEYGPPDSLVIEEVPSPEPKKGEVLLEVHSAAVNFPAQFASEHGFSIYLQPAGNDSVHPLLPPAPRLHFALPEHNVEFDFLPLE